MTRLKRSQYRDMPWKNGNGRTAEIDRVPLNERYLWRLSCATVSSDSEFSQFPGYDRWLVVIRGAGVFLNDFKLEKLVPHRFAGETPINCRLVDGEVVDLGLIFDREKIQAETFCFSVAPPAVPREVATYYVYDLDTGDTYKNEIPPVKNGVLIVLTSRS